MTPIALRWAVGLLVVLGAALLPAAEAPRQPEATRPEALRRYRLGLAPAVPWSPAHVALALGLWRDLGVTVTVTDHITASEQRIAVTHQQDDLTIDRVGGLIALQQSGVAMTLLGECGWAHDQERFAGRTTGGPARGAVIGVHADDPAVLGFLDLALRARGLGLTDVTINVLAPQDLAGDFIRRRLDWLVVEEPFAGDVLSRGAHRLATPADLPGCMPLAFAGRTDVVATIPPADLVLIFRGWIQATRWMADPLNAKACRALLVERTLIDPRDGAAALAMADAVRNHDPVALAERNRPDGGLAGYLARCAELLTATKRLSRPIDATAMIDTAALHTALTR